MTTRRDLLIALGAGALAALIPWLARAQTRLRRIGFLKKSDISYVERIEVFTAGMHDKVIE